MHNSCIFHAFGAVALAVAGAAEAQVQTLCGDTPQDLAAYLAKGYDEYQVAILTRGDIAPIVIFVARDGSSWTAAEVEAGGLTCVVDAGGRAMLTALPAPGVDG